MPGIAEREQERYGNRFGPAFPHAPCDVSCVLSAQRDYGVAMTVEALSHANAELRRHQLRWALHPKVVERRAVLPADLQHVLKAFRDEEGSAGASVLQQGVGGHGGAVGDVGVGRYLELLQPSHNRPGWVLRRGRRLEDPDLALSDQGEVGERAPDVHAQNGFAHLAANLCHAMGYVKARSSRLPEPTTLQFMAGTQ